eukprot:748195-Hanusia_phi.AAC.4
MALRQVSPIAMLSYTNIPEISTFDQAKRAARLVKRVRDTMVPKVKCDAGVSSLTEEGNHSQPRAPVSAGSMGHQDNGLCVTLGLKQPSSQTSSSVCSLPRHHHLYVFWLQIVGLGPNGCGCWPVGSELLRIH